MSKHTIGENAIVQVSEDGKTANVTFDMSHRGGLSKSGKSTTVATTSGFAKIPGTDVSINLHVFVK